MDAQEQVLRLWHPPAKVALDDKLGPLVERLLKYSDIRRNDPRESREALRDLIVGELADEMRAIRAAERERMLDELWALLATKPYATALTALAALTPSERPNFADVAWAQAASMPNEK